MRADSKNEKQARGRIREPVGSIVDPTFHAAADPNMKQRGGEVGFSRVLMCIHLPLLVLSHASWEESGDRIAHRSAFGCCLPLLSVDA
jgi:hypothetical protein